MSWESWKNKRKTKKLEKTTKKEEENVESLEELNRKRIEIKGKQKEIKQKTDNQKWLERTLDERELSEKIQTARSNLFIQRDKLLDRIRRYNKEYAFIQEKQDYVYKEKELKRCSTASKNAIYSLALVERAIDRLDDISSEQEWRMIVKDLTNAYKTVNAISVGSDLLTRLVFLFQKYRMEKKGNISVNAMEYYFGKPIDELLEESEVNRTASELIVDNSALVLQNEEDILNAVRYGNCYSVNPFDVVKLASEQSDLAEKTGGEKIFEQSVEVSETEVPTNYMDFLRDK